MADLPTNYLDDILSDSMGGKRRFKITHLNGTSEEVTIEDISKYDQVGSTFGAGDINRTNQAVNEKFDSGDVVDPMLTTEPGFAADAYKTKLQFDEQNKNLGGLRFGVDGEGNGGYFKADDSFVPFKKGEDIFWCACGNKNASSAGSVTIDTKKYTKMRIVAIKFSVPSGYSGTYYQITADGTQIRYVSSANAPIDVKDEEIDVSEYNSIVIKVRGNYTSGYYGVAIVAMS